MLNLDTIKDIGNASLIFNQHDTHYSGGISASVGCLGCL